MSFGARRQIIEASQYWLHTKQRQYGFALAAVAAAGLLRYTLAMAGGFVPPFILFYPTIMLVALLSGFGPGMFATVLASAIAEYFVLKPVKTLEFWPSIHLWVVLFIAIGATISWLGDMFRQRAERLREFEKAVEGMEEMVAVVDRGYRYVIANRAFKDYFGVSKEGLLGRGIVDVLSPEDFATIVKPKLDECFSGKVVQYQRRHRRSGEERDLFESYFPIEGAAGVDRAVQVLHDVSKRNRADQDLAASEKRFRAVYEQVPTGIALVEPCSGRFLEVNPKFCEILGRTEEDLLVRNFQSLTHPDDLQESLSRRAELTQGLTKRVHLDKRYLRSDGEEVWAQVSVSEIRRAQEPREVYLVTAQDITERRRAEAAIRESEDRYRDLIENSEDLVCTHDLEGRLLSVNPASARALGYEVAELMKMPIQELVAPEHREAFKSYLDRIRTKGVDQGSLSMVTRNGERRIWEYHCSLRTEGVASPIVRGRAHDITERKRAEAALGASEQRYRFLFEKNVAGVAISSMEGTVLDCNDAWAHMLGYGLAAEVRGRSAMEFYFNPEDRNELLEQLKKHGSFFSREIRVRKKDGTPVWMLFNTGLVETGYEGAPVMQATAIDITERKIAEQELQRKEEDYQQFVAQSSEGIFREEMDVAVAIDLPEDELVQQILHHAHLAECNDAMAKMYGFTAGQQLIGKRPSDLMAADDPRNIELIREYIRSGFSVLDRESHEVDVYGNPKVFRNSMIGIVENGKLLRTWGIQRDVSEWVKLGEARSRAEKALQASENHYRELVEQASDGIFIADASGRYLDVNSAGTEMLGYTREEILRLSIHDVIVPDDVPRVSPEVKRFASGLTVCSQWTFRRKDGSVFPGEVCGRQSQDGRLHGIVRDISERRAAEEEMRCNEERFRVALKDSPITVFNQDCELRYTWIYNPQLYWRPDAIGKTDTDVLGARKAAGLVELKKKVLKKGVAVREEVAIPYAGKNYAFDITIEPLFGPSGNVIGITGASIDIARLREITDRLQDARDKLEQENSYLENEIQAELGFKEIIGQSPELLEVLKSVRVVAPTSSTVLLLGETGSGKELIARSVHGLSSRRDNNFIKLNCAAVPAGLLESELFGHEKGAFTGAVNQKVGRIELADKGTIFLDEIGELPIELQPKLLRVLQDREFERLGGIHTLRVDVRIIAATNRDLRQDILDKRFREDLFYRLNVFPITLPSLRQRRTDIPVLVHHFVRKHSVRMGKNIEFIPDETMRILTSWSWPGNIRELENMIERMVILTKSRELAAPPVELESVTELSDDTLSEMQREHIVRVLRETNGVLSGTKGAVSRLGIKRTTLQSMLKRLGIDPQEYRGGNGFGAA